MPEFEVEKFERVIPVEAVRVTETNMIEVVRWLHTSGYPARIGHSTKGDPVIWSGTLKPGYGGPNFAAPVGYWIVLDGHTGQAVSHKFFKKEYRKALASVAGRLRKLIEADNNPSVWLRPGTRIVRVTHKMDGYEVTESMVRVSDLQKLVKHG